MRLFFGSKKQDAKPPTPAPQQLPDAIMQSREAISQLDKRKALLEKRVLQQEEEARLKAKNKDKRGAMMALKRKKMLQNELDALMNSTLTLEQQIQSLENAQSQKIAIGAIDAGVKAQKNMHQQMNIDDVDRLMEEMDDLQATQQEINNVLAQGNPIMDDDELLEELGQMEAEIMEDNLAQAGPVATGPVAVPAMAAAVPSQSSRPQEAQKTTGGGVGGLSKEEEDELAALQAQLG